MEQNETRPAGSSKYYRRKMLTSCFSSTMCISLVLYMAGLFFMLLFNTQHIGDMFRSNIKFTVTLNDSQTQAEHQQFIKTLDASDFVRESKYISKEESAQELKKDLGEDFVEILGRNPLYSQIEIKLAEQYSNIDSIKSVEKQLKTYPAVDEVYYPKDVWKNADTVLSKIAAIVLVLTIILLIVTIILISNSIRIQMSAKRFDIRTAKLIGASNVHISRPYIRRAFIQSIAAILISVGGLSLTISFLEKIVDGVFKISAFYPTLAVILILGIGVTYASAKISINKYLKLNEDELYY